MSVYTQKGETEQAVAYYRDALAIAGRDEGELDLQRHILAYNNLAHNLRLLGNSTAAQYALAGLHLAQEKVSLTHQPYLYSTLGEIALAQGNLESAEHYFADGLALAERLGSSERIAGLTANLGLVARAREEAEIATSRFFGMGYFADSKPDFTALNALVDLYAAMDQPIPPKYPLYGRDAHRTRAGIHADGLNKFWWMYAPFNVPELLGRPLEVSLTKDSGIAGLIFLIKQHLGMELPKDDPGLQAVYQWMMTEFDNGRQTSIEWEELVPIVREHLTQTSH